MLGSHHPLTSTLILYPGQHLDPSFAPSPQPRLESLKVPFDLIQPLHTFSIGDWWRWRNRQQLPNAQLLQGHADSHTDLHTAMACSGPRAPNRIECNSGGTNTWFCLKARLWCRPSAHTILHPLACSHSCWSTTPSLLKSSSAKWPRCWRPCTSMY